MRQIQNLIIYTGTEYSALRSYYQAVILLNNRRIVCRKLLCILIISMEKMVERTCNKSPHDSWRTAWPCHGWDDWLTASYCGVLGSVLGIRCELCGGWSDNGAGKSRNKSVHPVSYTTNTPYQLVCYLGDSRMDPIRPQSRRDPVSPHFEKRKYLVICLCPPLSGCPARGENSSRCYGNITQRIVYFLWLLIIRSSRWRFFKLWCWKYYCIQGTWGREQTKISKFNIFFKL
jgi:hypothetical protein